MAFIYMKWFCCAPCSYWVLMNMPHSVPTINIFYAQDWCFSLSLCSSEAGGVPSAVSITSFQQMLLLKLSSKRLLCITNLGFRYLGRTAFPSQQPKRIPRDRVLWLMHQWNFLSWKAFVNDKAQSTPKGKPSWCKCQGSFNCFCSGNRCLICLTKQSEKALVHSSTSNSVKQAVCLEPPATYSPASLIGYVWTSSHCTATSAPVDLISVQNAARDSPYSHYRGALWVLFK